MNTTLSASSIAPSVLPDILPIFPISGVVLMPHSRLPLNVFELRYMAMIEDALAMPGRMIGIIQPSKPESTDDQDAPLYKVGCAGRIVSFNETDDGRFQIGLNGICRFDVAEELPREKAYRRIRPDWSRFRADLDPSLTPEIPRKKMISALKIYFEQQNIEADWKVVEMTPDDLLVSSLMMICPLAPNERQALLEASDIVTRVVMLTALLEMAIMPQGRDGEAAARH